MPQYYDAHFKTEHDASFTKLKLGLPWGKLIEHLITENQIEFTIVPHGTHVRAHDGWPKNGTKPIMTGKLFNV